MSNSRWKKLRFLIRSCGTSLRQRYVEKRREESGVACKEQDEDLKINPAE